MLINSAVGSPIRPLRLSRRRRNRRPEIFLGAVLAAIMVGSSLVWWRTRTSHPVPYDPQHLHDVVFEDESESLLVAGHNGVWRLTATGAEQLGPADMHVRALAADGGLVFAAGSPSPGTDLTGVLQSADGGRSWTTTGTGGGLDVQALAVDGVNLIAADSSPPRVLASAARVVWTERSAGPVVSRMVLDPQTISQLLAIADGVLQRGYEGGHSWRIDPISTMPATELLDLEWPSPSLLYALSGNGDVFLSTDSGRTWTVLGPAPRDAVALAVRDDDGLLAVITSDGRAALSRDGRSWRQIAPPT